MEENPTSTGNTISLTAEAFRERWFGSLRNIFITEGGNADGLAQWSDIVYRPGFTFTFIDERSSPFPDRSDYQRLCAFAKQMGDESFLAHYASEGWEDHGDPNRIVAGRFSSSASWDEMRISTVGFPADVLDDRTIVPPLAFDYGSTDMYIWSPRSLWGICHSSDGEVAIAGTWGPGATAMFRKTFGIEGDGWTAELENGYGAQSANGRAGAPLVTDLYVRRPLVPLPPPVGVSEALPAAEQPILHALYRLALAAAQPGSGADAAGEAQVRGAIAAALRRDYSPAVVVGLDASDPAAAPAVRTAAEAVVVAVHALGDEE